MTKLNEKDIIRNEILMQETPFCIIDLYRKINKGNKFNGSLIRSTLDELYEYELVKYDKCVPEDKGNFGYAFYVPDDVIADTKKLVMAKQKLNNNKKNIV